MTYYTGDIAGDFVWEYDGDHRHVQDPLFLQKYGGLLETKCVWEGCHCYIPDNNLPYCMQCYNSTEEHKSMANANDLKSKTPSVEMRIFRADFEEQVRPWLEENEAVACEDVKYLTFLTLGDTVHYDEWECTHNSPNFYIVQQYCFFKQMEYYFDHFEENECCIFYIH